MGRAGGRGGGMGMGPAGSRPFQRGGGPSTEGSSLSLGDLLQVLDGVYAQVRTTRVMHGAVCVSYVLYFYSSIIHPPFMHSTACMHRCVLREIHTVLLNTEYTRDLHLQ